MPQKNAVWLSCLLGGIIGGGIAFATYLQYQFSLWLALPVGILVGSGVAYLWYDIAGVRTGVAQAYREVIAWQPDWKWWWKLLSNYLAALVISYTMLATIVVPAIVLTPVMPPEPDYMISFMATTFLVTAYSLLLTVIGMNDCLPIRKAALKYVNPIALSIWTVIGLARFAIWIGDESKTTVPAAIKKTWKWAKAVVLFCRTAFRYIHSQGRLIVAVDTAIGIVCGVVLGLYLDNPLLGTLACGVVGAGLGELNYRIVAIRWLKLQPA